MSKYGVFSGPYFPVFRPNTRKYGPEKTPYLYTFHAVIRIMSVKRIRAHEAKMTGSIEMEH